MYPAVDREAGKGSSLKVQKRTIPKNFIFASRIVASDFPHRIVNGRHQTLASLLVLDT